MNYPKLPFGPSSTGTAGVRALQAEGGEFQRTRRDVNTLSILQDDNSKVITGGIEYVTAGEVNSGSVKARATQRYKLPFMPAKAPVVSIYMGKGKYAGWNLTSSATDDLIYGYTVSPIGPVAYSITRRTTGLNAVTASYYGNGRTMAGMTVDQYTVSSAILSYRLVTPNLTLTPKTEPVPDEQQVATFLLVDNGRIDVAGRPLFDIAPVSLYRTHGPIGRVLDVGAFTRSNAEFSPFMPAVSTHNTLFVLIAENFFKYGTPGTAGADPMFWMLHYADHNMDSGAVSNVTSIMFYDIWIPPPQPANPLDGTPELYLPQSGTPYNAYLSRTMGTALTVALPGNVALYFYRVFCDDEQWHQRVAKISSGGGLSIDITMDVTDPDDEIFIQDAVHLGDNWVLAKKVYGFPGVDHEVALILSTDGGSTWSEHAFIGFTAPNLNQYFGNMIVHKPRTIDGPGIVLITAWDATASVYRAYASKDDGATWTKAGKIYKPDEFRRVDGMVDGDGGSNFETLQPGPDPTRAVDVTMPDRYNG
jgi:hypothetical protein